MDDEHNRRRVGDGLVGQTFLPVGRDESALAQRVNVTVMEIDLPRKRIALSMKAAPVIGPGNPSQRTSPAAPRPASGGFNRPATPAKPAAVDWFTAALGKNKGGN